MSRASSREIETILDALREQNWVLALREVAGG